MTKDSLGIFLDDELRKVLQENPDLPIICLTYLDQFSGEYDSEFATSVYAEVGEVLQCHQEFDELRIFTERDDFEEAVYDSFPDAGFKSDIEEEVKKILEQYEPYWTKCIIITVGN